MMWIIVKIFKKQFINFLVFNIYEEDEDEDDGTLE